MCRGVSALGPGGAALLQHQRPVSYLPVSHPYPALLTQYLVDWFQTWPRSCHRDLMSWLLVSKANALPASLPPHPLLPVP